MKFEDAIEYININGQYYKEGGKTFKLKIAPLEPKRLVKYMSDVMYSRKTLTNDDAKLYVSINVDEFVLIPFDVSVLPEETFKF